MHDFKEVDCLNLSIVIPVYNSERTLERCVDSLLVQIQEEVEIILVDDGSTDKTYQILEKYKDNNHIIMRYKEHGGVSKARNDGISAASGKYISFVDSDDFVGEGYIDTLLDAIKTNNDIVVFDVSYKIDKYGNICDEMTGIDIRGEYPSERMYPYLLGQKMNSVWGKLFKKNILMKCEIKFDESMIISEDFMFVMNYLEQCTTARVCEKISYYYEYNPEGTWRVHRQHMDDLIKSYSNCCEFIKKNHVVLIDMDWQKQLMNCRFLRHLCSIVVGLYDKRKLSEERVNNLVVSSLYKGVTEEKYKRFKYNLLKLLIQNKNWKILSLVFKVKGIN